MKKIWEAMSKLIIEFVEFMALPFEFLFELMRGDDNT